jgi:hypothetical protein
MIPVVVAGVVVLIGLTATAMRRFLRATRQTPQVGSVSQQWLSVHGTDDR